ncbi:NUDIX hydrolase [Brevibacillus ginsengisoli]|uniref:NUDIX hydrolase n=1 Tax=Brevibacillus ginsengisoli TaxID=363854 RepID=UPI003CF878AC
MSITRLVYTVCFLKQKDKLLMLNRESQPNMGLWNGVGGKIEPGESAQESVIREVREETGMVVDQVQFGGIVTWEASLPQTDKPAKEGMYLFLAELPEDMEITPVQKMEEGILAWKEISWVMNTKNLGIASNIRSFLPNLLAGHEPREYFCTYQQDQFSNCEVLPLPKQIDPMIINRFPQFFT